MAIIIKYCIIFFKKKTILTFDYCFSISNLEKLKKIFTKITIKPYNIYNKAFISSMVEFFANYIILLNCF